MDTGRTLQTSDLRMPSISSSGTGTTTEYTDGPGKVTASYLILMSEMPSSGEASDTRSALRSFIPGAHQLWNSPQT